MSDQISELKAWVTDNYLEDDEFCAMSRARTTRKADWVAYVNRKLQAADIVPESMTVRAVTIHFTDWLTVATT
jgi:hypothetical protein